MRKVVVAGAIIALGLGITATWAASRVVDRSEHPSAIDGPHLEISSLDVAPRATITVAGDGCGADAPAPVGQWNALVWLSPAAGTVPWDPAFGDPVAEIVPDDDGGWSATLTVPRWPTEYRLEAACFDDAAPPNGFLYAHERIDAR